MMYAPVRTAANSSASTNVLTFLVGVLLIATTIQIILEINAPTVAEIAQEVKTRRCYRSSRAD